MILGAPYIVPIYFIYGLAFEDGFVHPESLIDDRPLRFGSYAPENFDMSFQGTVPVHAGGDTSLQRRQVFDLHIVYMMAHEMQTVARK